MGDAWKRAHRDQVNTQARARRSAARDAAPVSPVSPAVQLSKNAAAVRLRQKLTDIEARLIEISEVHEALVRLQLRERLRVLESKVQALEDRGVRP